MYSGYSKGVSCHVAQQINIQHSFENFKNLVRDSEDICIRFFVLVVRSIQQLKFLNAFYKKGLIAVIIE